MLHFGGSEASYQVFLREVSAGKILVTATHDLSLFHGDERILKIENCKVTA